MYVASYVRSCTYVTLNELMNSKTILSGMINNTQTIVSMMISTRKFVPKCDSSDCFIKVKLPIWL